MADRGSERERTKKAATRLFLRFWLGIVAFFASKNAKSRGQLLEVTRSAPSSLLFRARFCRNPAEQV